eukprot:m.70711 g.70711  ORF g.70711 m.70711 type:complete len:270 (+) comp12156_c0_seq1:110-919(+)
MPTKGNKGTANKRKRAPASAASKTATKRVAAEEGQQESTPPRKDAHPAPSSHRPSIADIWQGLLPPELMTPSNERLQAMAAAAYRHQHDQDYQAQAQAAQQAAIRAAAVAAAEAIAASTQQPAPSDAAGATEAAKQAASQIQHANYTQMVQKGAVPPPASTNEPTPAHLRNAAMNMIFQGYQPTAQRETEKEVLDKKSRRLYKNKLAAKECRRKKKEYISTLEERVRLLETRTQLLYDELKQTLPDLPTKEKQELQRRIDNKYKAYVEI